MIGSLLTKGLWQAGEQRYNSSRDPIRNELPCSRVMGCVETDPSYSQGSSFSQTKLPSKCPPKRAKVELRSLPKKALPSRLRPCAHRKETARKQQQAHHERVATVMVGGCLMRRDGAMAARLCSLLPAAKPKRRLSRRCRRSGDLLNRLRSTHLP